MNTDKIFIWSSPLYWIFILIALIHFIYEQIYLALSYLGVIDWFYVKFRFHKMPKQGKMNMLRIYESRKDKMFWLKRKSWDIAINMINKEIQLKNEINN